MMYTHTHIYIYSNYIYAVLYCLCSFHHGLASELTDMDYMPVS